MFKRLSWPLFIASIVTWTSKVIGDWNFKINWFFDDLKNSQNPEEAIKIMEEHEKWVKEYKDSKWESIKVVKYKDDTPYIIYKNQIWEITTISNDWLSNTPIIWDISAIDETNIDWIDSTKVNLVWENIVMWEWKTVNINMQNLINQGKIDEKSIKLTKSLLEKWAKYLGRKIKYSSLEWDHIKYIEIGKINENVSIIMKSMWEIKIEQKSN